MRDPNVLNADIRAYLAAENDFTAAIMDPLSDEVDVLFAEMKGRVKEDDLSVPCRTGIGLITGVFAKVANIPCSAGGRVTAGTNRSCSTVTRRPKDTNYFKLGAFEHSPDHSLAAYALDQNGSEIFTIRFRDLASGDDMPEVIGESNGGLAWSIDGQTIFYTVLDDNHRPHAVKTPAGDGSQGGSLDLQGTGSRLFCRYIDDGKPAVHCDLAHDHQTSESYLIPADAPDTTPYLVAPRIVGTEYDLSDQDDRFLIAPMPTRPRTSRS